jgi:hypothetical protein
MREPVILLVILVTCCGGQPLAMPDEQVLISQLLYSYDAASRPVYNASQSVEVKFGMSFIQICDMVYQFETRVN